MFERGLFIDDGWISNGEAFWQPTVVKNINFIEKFMKDRAKATIELFPVSKPFLYLDNWSCIVFDSEKEFILVQIENLELVGVNLGYLEEYQFWMNPDTYLIYIYDPDFIGGTLPLHANKEKLKPVYPEIGKE